MPDRLSPQEAFSLVPRPYHTATILHVLSNRFLLVKKPLYCSSSAEVVSSGEAPTPAGTCEKFAHTGSVKLNIMGIWEWGIYGS